MKKQKKQYRYIKLPGTHKQRNRARNLLKCHQVNGNTWVINGGEGEHVVKLYVEELSCSCDVFQKEKKLCSHVIKVQMELGIFPERKLVEVK